MLYKVIIQNVFIWRRLPSSDRNVFIVTIQSTIYIRLAVDFFFSSYFCSKHTLWVNVRNAYVSFAAQIRMYTPIYASYTTKSGVGGPLAEWLRS